MTTILLCFLALTAGAIGGFTAHVFFTHAILARFRASVDKRVLEVGPAVAKHLRSWDTKIKTESAALHKRVMALEAKRK